MVDIDKYLKKGFCRDETGWDVSESSQYILPKRPIRKARLLSKSEIMPVVASTELAFICFYTSWDIYSNMVMQIFDRAVDALRQQYPHARKLVLAKVNCASDGSIRVPYDVFSYPTIKMFRNGYLVRGKYQEAIHSNTLYDFVIAELQDPVKHFSDIKELANVCDSQNIIIGYFDRNDMPEYSNYRRVAQNLKGYCDFYVKFGDNSKNNWLNNPVINFIPKRGNISDIADTFIGLIKNYGEFNIWAHQKCMVRELKFDNYDDLMNSIYPLFILYYNPNDISSIKAFKEIVGKTMNNRKHDIDFVAANGLEFTDAVHKYEKKETDLPLIAIEKGDQTFLFPNPIDINKPEELKDFFNEYYIGKLQYIARTGGEWTKQASFLENPRGNMYYETV